MKSPIRLLSLMIAATAFTLLVSGCYTQLTTRGGDMESSSAAYEQPGTYEEGDTLAPQEDYSNYVFDDYDTWRPHYWMGMDFYYPSYSWWGYPYGDPFFYGYYGYPYYSYYGFPYNGYYGYYGSPYYGYPYSYYRGYPFVVYAGNTRNYQTRESGYRRSGMNRVGGYYGTSGTPSGSVSAAPAGRRAGSSSVAPSRSVRSSPSSAPTRSYVPRSSGRSRQVAPAGRSSAPRVRSAPSRGSSGRSGTSGGSRSSGSHRSGRSRSYYQAPSAGSYRSSAPAYRSYTPPARSYTPSYSPSSSRSSAPASSAPRSGGSSGGSRSSGATRSGHR